jgi:hypothetical protein
MPNQKNSLLAVLTPSLRFFLAGFFLTELSGMYTLYMPLFISELGASPAEIGLVYALAEVVPSASVSSAVGSLIVSAVCAPSPGGT